MNDDQDLQLDALFASARTLGPADIAAAERVLPHLRDAHARRQRSVVRAWTSGLLASAAMLGAILYVRQDATLPTSAAYETYNSISGSGW
ncbi:hypothetical protein [Deinococcus yavapaiensis]|uniref:DUF3619 family protein n=1 Tax=Deinococcus yavapaiensis KR-236 TaxID=694435 RepID=A0A318SGB4_9DEIO|nr:hypothetical protein [Deinococcus yavapaiensis]PYE48940.1 hypothetical protein DES52_1266 [Deinococcus yavapaiensis KR-236]